MSPYVVDASSGAELVSRMSTDIAAAAAWLSELDGAAGGDGDHGVNMRKGFTLAAGRVGPDGDISTALHELSETLMNDVGGAMGPLYGVFFDGLATACERQPFLTATTIEQMLERARDEVIAIGGARVGDKTLVDVLAPASDAFADRLREGASLQTALEDMAVAAEDHRDATRQMVARIGRAARAGERSGGRIDAGAASCAVILRSLSSSFQDRPTGHPTP